MIERPDSDTLVLTGRPTGNRALGAVVTLSGIMGTYIGLDHGSYPRPSNVYFAVTFSLCIAGFLYAIYQTSFRFQRGSTRISCTRSMFGVTFSRKEMLAALLLMSSKQLRHPRSGLGVGKANKLAAFPSTVGEGQQDLSKAETPGKSWILTAFDELAIDPHASRRIMEQSSLAKELSKLTGIPLRIED